MPLKKAVTSGPSDYQVAVNNGFSGNPMDWQSALVGTQKVTIGPVEPPVKNIGDVWIIPIN